VFWCEVYGHTVPVICIGNPTVQTRTRQRGLRWAASVFKTEWEDCSASGRRWKPQGTREAQGWGADPTNYSDRRTLYRFHETVDALRQHIATILSKNHILRYFLDN
jgi:hypothetical protein